MKSAQLSSIALLSAFALLLGACNSRSEEPSFLPEETPSRRDNAGAEGTDEERSATRDERVAPEPAAGDIPAPPDVAAPPADAEQTASGLATKVLRPGTGTAHPSTQDRVSVHYTGWTTDGAMFDSSVVRGEPTSFGVTQVIAGWTEALQLMVEGEKRRVWIPEDLAYRGQPGRPAGMLVFDVELIEIVH